MQGSPIKIGLQLACLTCALAALLAFVFVLITERKSQIHQISSGSAMTLGALSAFFAIWSNIL